MQKMQKKIENCKNVQQLFEKSRKGLEILKYRQKYTMLLSTHSEGQYNSL